MSWQEVRHLHRASMGRCMIGSAVCGATGTMVGLLVATGHEVVNSWGFSFLLSLVVTTWAWLGWLKRDESMDHAPR